MLHSISWSQFFTVIALLSVTYYAISAILFYRSEIASLLNRRHSQSESNHSKSDEETHEAIMGRTRLIDIEVVPQETQITSDQLRIAPTKEVDNDHLDSESLLVGTVSDLLEEIKSLTIRISNGSKEDLTPIFQELLSRYPQLINTQYQEAINLFIANACQEHGSWEFEPHEVVALWPEKNQPSTHH